jgi:hypothetical protein
MSCQNLTVVPYDMAGGHWDPLTVGVTEVMTPCVIGDFYGNIRVIYMYVCMHVCIYVYACTYVYDIYTYTENT